MLQNCTYNEIETALNNGFNLFHVFTPAGFMYVASIELPTVPDAFIIAKIPTAKIKNGWRNYVGSAKTDEHGRPAFYWLDAQNRRPGDVKKGLRPGAWPSWKRWPVVTTKRQKNENNLKNVERPERPL